jgi:hypothetical protein
LKDHPEVMKVLSALPPKVISISSSGCAPRALPEQHESNHVVRAVARIEAATFTAGSDKAMVVDKYKGYIWRVGRTLAKGSLAFANETQPSGMPIMPDVAPLAVDAVAAAPLQLAEGLLVCLLPDPGAAGVAILATVWKLVLAPAELAATPTATWARSTGSLASCRRPFSATSPTTLRQHG